MTIYAYIFSHKQFNLILRKSHAYFASLQIHFKLGKPSSVRQGSCRECSLKRSENKYIFVLVQDRQDKEGRLAPQRFYFKVKYKLPLAIFKTTTPLSSTENQQLTAATQPLLKLKRVCIFLQTKYSKTEDCPSPELLRNLSSPAPDGTILPKPYSGTSKNTF